MASRIDQIAGAVTPTEPSGSGASATTAQNSHDDHRTGHGNAVASREPEANREFVMKPGGPAHAPKSGRKLDRIAK
ncbi:hypothetical protein HAP48_0031500 [Bradyrhizobium septentrionale]|uniref:hypothetical protein n=1 Tax=Bradyrhizobium septentrionale TaxID=1404411 RepID=UPI001408F39D|nr:hypothetical protein [Bradyrhizobium septentrionale]UGY13103.1 hypothetical protein HAP48_0031500 [Bradyrhizobium septentrionale]